MQSYSPSFYMGSAYNGDAFFCLQRDLFDLAALKYNSWQGMAHISDCKADFPNWHGVASMRMAHIAQVDSLPNPKMATPLRSSDLARPQRRRAVTLRGEKEANHRNERRMRERRMSECAQPEGILLRFSDR